MKAMILKHFGGIENFSLKEIPEPQVGKNNSNMEESNNKRNMNEIPKNVSNTEQSILDRTPVGYCQSVPVAYSLFLFRN